MRQHRKIWKWMCRSLNDPQTISNMTLWQISNFISCFIIALCQWKFSLCQPHLPEFLDLAVKRYLITCNKIYKRILRHWNVMHSNFSPVFPTSICEVLICPLYTKHHCFEAIFAFYRYPGSFRVVGTPFHCFPLLILQPYFLFSACFLNTSMNTQLWI